jgi:transposase
MGRKRYHAKGVLPETENIILGLPELADKDTRSKPSSPFGRFHRAARRTESPIMSRRSDYTNILSRRRYDRNPGEYRARSPCRYHQGRTTLMRLDFGDTKIFIRPGTTDMRKAINGLTSMAETAMGMSPFSGALFLFCGKTRKLIKAFYWERNGFCLWQKRLERDRFPWPDTEEGVKELNTEEIAMLLDGIDFFHAHRRISFEKAG